MNKLRLTRIFLTTALVSGLVGGACAQPEVEPWGNITGIRMDGQLMEFESSLCVVGKDWSTISSTGQERQRPRYSRDGKRQTITTRIDSAVFTEQIDDAGTGLAKVQISYASHGDNQTSHGDNQSQTAYFSIALPGEDYADGSMQLIDPAPVTLNQTQAGGPNEYFRAPAGGVRFIAAHRQLEIRFAEPRLIIGVKEGSSIRLYLPLRPENIFSIKTTGDIDRDTIHLALNAAQTGRVFDGLGGNFRLQNPQTDPQVIDYCLKNLRVAYGRVEMPWRFWQPQKDGHPIDSAETGKLNPFVQRAMEMAQTLNKKGIPLILSCWSAPNWAIDGPPRFRPGPDHVWGNPLNEANMQEIYRSITDYIIYLKKHLGVEIKLFSFNESDLGINIRVTAEEHARLIAGLGAYFASHGVGTKMLLGDNSDATTYAFIYTAMSDSAAIPYIGAVSFHSWRGWDKATLEKWADAATKLHVPLLVGEGSIDAAAWNYPAIFEEQIYAIKEITLYTRLLAICQPESILQWQLTADYSPLAGGGIFGSKDTLHPTWRFWNLKQLASTPKGLFAMPLACDRPNISCAALGDNRKGIYALHLVNNGAAREATLTGLPKKIKFLRIYTTNKEQAVKEGQRIIVEHGTATCRLDAVSYITLVNQ
jgi:hypothetical protein